ncbi:MAG: ABC transporter permease [Verrucomicrobiota bacterium]
MNDLKFAFRQLLKNPGFTAVAVPTLALGIGASTAIFSVLDAVVLRRVPFNQPHQLVQVWEDPGGKGSGRNSVSGGVFADWREQTHAFQQFAALWGIEANLTGLDEPERITGTQVSANFFDLLQVQPMLGRGFLLEEDRPGRNQVVILDHALWQRRFGATPHIINQAIHLDGRSYTVIGVLPPQFRFPGREAQYWIPFGWGSAWWHQSRENNRLQVFARLKPEVTVGQARAEMRAVTERLKPVYPTYKKEWGATILPMIESLVGDARLPLIALMGAAGFVLLIACLNVANLILVRTAARETELAVRSALGASRRRLNCQLLTESLTLALAGGAVGVALAVWGTDLLVSLIPQDLPRLAEVGVDGRVLAFSLALSLLTGGLCGSAAAWNASKLNLNQALKAGGGGGLTGAPRRVAGGLVVLEVSLALLLLIGAGLFLRSFHRLSSVDPGFAPGNVLTMQISLPPSKYPAGEHRERFFQQALERIEALPGVNSAGVCTSLPFVQAHDNGVKRSGRPDAEYFGADYDFATPRYFQALGIPQLRGRLLTAADQGPSPRVAVVSQAFVRRGLPDADPIGQRFIENGAVEMEVIGVVGDVKERRLYLPSMPHYYKPMASTDWSDFHLFVRTTGPSLELAASVRKAILAVDPDQPVASIRTMADVLSESVAGERSLMVLNGSFAAVALLLAALGLYGIIAYAVGRRTREIGIRMALGARRREVLGMIVGEGMRLVGLGLITGLAAALALTRLLTSLLYEVKSTDPLTFAVVVLVLAGVALVACWLPARRASKVDPMEALRYE